MFFVNPCFVTHGPLISGSCLGAWRLMPGQLYAFLETTTHTHTHALILVSVDSSKCFFFLTSSLSRCN